MGRRFFWFAAGVGLAVLVVLKGKEYYRRFTPAGVTEQIEEAGKNVRGWLTEFADTFQEAYTDREAELREALGLDAEPEGVQETSR